MCSVCEVVFVIALRHRQVLQHLCPYIKDWQSYYCHPIVENHRGAHVNRRTVRHPWVLVPVWGLSGESSTQTQTHTYTHGCPQNEGRETSWMTNGLTQEVTHMRPNDSHVTHICHGICHLLHMHHHNNSRSSHTGPPRAITSPFMFTRALQERKPVHCTEQRMVRIRRLECDITDIRSLWDITNSYQ